MWVASQIKGNVEKGIVVAGLMGDGDVERPAVVEEGVRRVPVIIAEIPARVLAQDDHKARPEQDGQAQESASSPAAVQAGGGTAAS